MKLYVCIKHFVSKVTILLLAIITYNLFLKFVVHMLKLERINYFDEHVVLSYVEN